MTQQEFYELYNKNSPKNKNRKAGPIDAKLFLRDLSLPIAYFCAKRGVSTNAITVLFLLLSLFANVVFIIPSMYTIIILVILHEIGQLLDCVDGQLARFHGVSSKYGENFDALAHVLISGSFMIAFGMRLFLESNNPFFLVFAAVGAFSKAFEHNMVIENNAFLDNKSVRKLYVYSRIRRYIVYGIHSVFEEIRIFAAALLILSILAILIPGSKFVELSFVLLVIFSIGEHLIYKTYFTIAQLRLVKKREWKGWS